MATHRDSGAAESGASSYPGQPYHDVDYPTAGPGYPTGRDSERRYAERIPRYPDAGQPETPPDDAARRRAAEADELRLTDEDRAPRPTSPAPPPEQRPVESPTTTYQPTAPGGGESWQAPQPPVAAGQAAQQPAPQWPSSQQIAAQQVPSQSVPGQLVPGQPAAGQQVPGQQVPGQPAAGQPVPATSMPGQPQPSQQLPGQQQPSQQVPAQQQGAGPSQPLAAQTAPGQQATAGQQPNAALSDLLHEPTQLTEQVPVYPGGTESGAGTVHRSHTQLGWLLGTLAVLFDIPVAAILVRSLTSDGVVVSGVVAGLLLLPGLPMLAAGLYNLFAGRVTVRPGDGVAALLRPRLALLVAGIVLVIAGALAAG